MRRRDLRRDAVVDNDRSPRDPGTYMFHCHNEATEHMEMGMLGNLIVRPRQDEFVANNPALAPSYNGKAYTRFIFNDCDNLPEDVTAAPPGGFALGGQPGICGSTGFDKDYMIQFADIDHLPHNQVGWIASAQPRSENQVAALNRRALGDHVKRNIARHRAEENGIGIGILKLNIYR